MSSPNASSTMQPKSTSKVEGDLDRVRRVPVRGRFSPKPPRPRQVESDLDRVRRVLDRGRFSLKQIAGALKVSAGDARSFDRVVRAVESLLGPGNKRLAQRHLRGASTPNTLEHTLFTTL